MTNKAIIFGSPKPKVQYTERRAAYVVIVDGKGTVAMVRAMEKHFLPGGGSVPGEAPEETVMREVYEELGRSVRLIRRLGEAVQYFYSSTDAAYYRMTATFFAGEFTEQSGGAGEHELSWLPVNEIEHACFHACHAWAVRQA
jgi:8-oxo-dGTP pyrophosphatase MutT (NUDIX family)